MERKAQYIRTLRKQRSAAAGRLVMARRTADDLTAHRVMIAQRELDGINATIARVSR